MQIAWIRTIWIPNFLKFGLGIQMVGLCAMSYVPDRLIEYRTSI